MAVAILALMGGLMWGTFDNAYRTKALIEASDERDQAVRVALSRLSRDISMAFLSEHYDHTRYQQRPTFFRGEDHGDEDQLTFTAFAYRRMWRNQKASDQAIFSFYLDQDPDNPDQKDLWLRVKTVIDDQPDEGGTKEVLADGITGLDVNYWDVQKQDWVDSWDTSQVEHQGALPSRVKIALTAKGAGDKEEKFVTEVEIPLVAPLNF